MIATNPDHEQSYTLKVEVYANSQQAIMTCLTDLIAKYQQEGVAAGRDTITGQGYEAFTQTLILD